MRYITKTACLALFLGATACGPLYDDGLGKTFLDVASQVTGAGTPDAPAAPTVSPALANAGPGDILLVTITGRNAVAPLVRVAQDARTTTWASPSNVTMAFQDGILVGTRGLGDDLMGVDAIGVRAAIDAGGGTAQRRHSFMDSEDQIITNTLTCTITRVGSETIALADGPHNTVRFDEDCAGPTLIFTNKYWMEGNVMRRSNQALSTTLGFIIADQL